MAQRLIREYPVLREVDQKPHLVQCSVCESIMPLASVPSHLEGAKHAANIANTRSLQDLCRRYGDYFRAGNSKGTVVCTLCNTGNMSWSVIDSHARGSNHTDALTKENTKQQQQRPIQNHVASNPAPNAAHPQQTPSSQYLQQCSSPNFYCCTLCQTGSIHINNLRTHLDGVVHRQNIQHQQQRQQQQANGRSTGANIRPSNTNGFTSSSGANAVGNNNNGQWDNGSIPDVFRVGSIENHFVCSLCETGNISRAGIHSHLSGAGHQRQVEHNILALKVARLCAANSPYLVPWPSDLLRISCSLCSQWDSMHFEDALSHLESADHKDRIVAIRKQKKRMLYHDKNSLRDYGGYGKRPDEEAIKELKSQELQDLPYFDLPQEYIPIGDLADFPSHADLVVAREQLVTSAVKKLSILTNGLVAAAIPKLPLRINLLSEMAKANLPISALRTVLQSQLYIAEANETTELKAYSKTDIILNDAGYNYSVHMPGVAENRPSVMRGDRILIHQDPKVMGGNGKTYYAYVHHVNVDNIVFSLPQSFVYRPEAFIYSIVFKVTRTQIRKLHRAVLRCEERSMLFIPATVGPDGYHSLTNGSAFRGAERTVLKLNPEQREFISHVHGHNRVSALWGPPGTGKTTTLVAAILDTLLKSQFQAKILICTPSNEAADHIVERILVNEETRHLYHNNNFLIRLNGFTRDPKSVPDAIRAVSCVAANGSFTFPSVTQIKRYQLVVTTLMSADRLFAIGLGNDHFTHLVVDEAGHATEQLLLIGLNLTSSRTKVVVAGDPKQLGPRVTLPPLALLNVYQSPLQRLQENERVWQMIGSQLLRCYRSHPAIVHLINTCYNERLVATKNEENLFSALWTAPLIRDKYWLLHNRNSHLTPSPLKPPRQPILCLTHTHPEQREADSPSWMNTFELFTLTDIILELHKQGLAKFNEIAVITPYRKQVQRITDKLYSTLMADFGLKRHLITHDPVTGQLLRRAQIPVKVATVDSFQGRESRVVIVSCVRSAMDAAHHDPKFGIGFLKQPERTNVALSRAKDLLIVIGNRNVLCTDDTWREYFSRLDAMDDGVVLNLGGPTLAATAGISLNDAGHEEHGVAVKEDW